MHQDFHASGQNGGNLASNFTAHALKDVPNGENGKNAQGSNVTAPKGLNATALLFVHALFYGHPFLEVVLRCMLEEASRDSGSVKKPPDATRSRSGRSSVGMHIQSAVDMMKPTPAEIKLMEAFAEEAKESTLALKRLNAEREEKLEEKRQKRERDENERANEAKCKAKEEMRADLAYWDTQIAGLDKKKSEGTITKGDENYLAYCRQTQTKLRQDMCPGLL